MDTEKKYRAITDRIGRGDTALRPEDARFYLSYCNRNGIAPAAVTEDAAAGPVSTDLRRRRYEDIMDRLCGGRSVDAVDYQFLKRYCQKERLPLPAVESRMQFWLKNPGATPTGHV